MEKAWMVLIMVVVVVMFVGSCHGQCEYSAMYNFGDSTGDTGAVHMAFPGHELAERYPYGRTFFGRPSGRYSDGRLSIDLLCQAMHFPLLSPFLLSISPNFSHGANFAAAGATALDLDSSFIAPISLPVQLNQFRLFKQTVLHLLSKNGPMSNLPQSSSFDDGLYVLQIGGNDFSYAYMSLNISSLDIRSSVLPRIANSIVVTAQELYTMGARTILVMDVGPQGCQPFWLSFFPHSSDDFDKNGCSISYNNAVKLYNRILKDLLGTLRQEHREANFVYVNTYDILYDFFVNPSNYGFNYTTKACCGLGSEYNFTYRVQCGTRGVIDGKNVFADSCANPREYVSWDGVHWTDAANRILARQILSGNYFEPSNFSLSAHCVLHDI